MSNFSTKLLALGIYSVLLAGGVAAAWLTFAFARQPQTPPRANSPAVQTEVVTAGMQKATAARAGQLKQKTAPPMSVDRVAELEALIARKNELIAQQALMVQQQASRYGALESELTDYFATLSRLIEELETFRVSAEDAVAERSSAVEETQDQATGLVSDLADQMMQLRMELESMSEQLTTVQEEALRQSALAEERLADVHDASFEVLSVVGEASVAPLTALLHDSRPSVRGWAARALGRLGVQARPAVASLREALSDSDEGVRTGAREALGAIQP